MIENVIFDFGDVFINLDKSATFSALHALGVKEITEEMMQVSQLYEVGKITTKEFVLRFNALYPKISEQQFIDAWNAILKDFPLHRLDFLKELAASNKYRLFLLSNTNDLHISWIQNNWGMELYEEFKSQFEQFYLSHEIHLRKPNADIFEFVLKENELLADETFFIDDTEANTHQASLLGIHVWNNDPATEDVVDLLSQKEFRS